jgi:hypothetical protein
MKILCQQLLAGAAFSPINTVASVIAFTGQTVNSHHAGKRISSGGNPANSASSSATSLRSCDIAPATAA